MLKAQLRNLFKSKVGVIESRKIIQIQVEWSYRAGAAGQSTTSIFGIHLKSDGGLREKTVEWNAANNRSMLNRSTNPLILAANSSLNSSSPSNDLPSTLLNASGIPDTFLPRGPLFEDGPGDESAQEESQNTSVNTSTNSTNVILTASALKSPPGDSSNSTKPTTVKEWQNSKRLLTAVQRFSAPSSGNIWEHMMFDDFEATNTEAAENAENNVDPVAARLTASSSSSSSTNAVNTSIRALSASTLDAQESSDVDTIDLSASQQNDTNQAAQPVVMTAQEHRDRQIEENAALFTEVNFQTSLFRSATNIMQENDLKIGFYRKFLPP